MGVDYPGLGKTEEGSPGWCSGMGVFNVFNEQTITFDYCTCMSGCEYCCCFFLDLVNCKPLVPSEHLLTPGVSVHMRSSHKSYSINVEGRSTNNAYVGRSFYNGLGVCGETQK